MPWFTWKYLGTKPMLASLHGQSLPPKPCKGDGGMTFCEQWEKRPTVAIIEGTPKAPQYAFSKRLIFMDMESYDQITVPEDQVREPLKWVLPSQEIEVLYVDEQPTDVQVPSAVELAVEETEPGIKGDTASGGGDKPAKLESGVTVRVPLFVNEGDRVRVDTRSGEYVSRA